MPNMQGAKTDLDLYDNTNLLVLLQMDTSQLGVPRCLDPAEDCSVGMLLNLRSWLLMGWRGASHGSQTSASLTWIIDAMQAW